MKIIVSKMALLETTEKKNLRLISTNCSLCNKNAYKLKTIFHEF